MIFIIQDLFDYLVLAGSILVLALIILLFLSKQAKNQPVSFIGKIFSLLKNNTYWFVFIVSATATLGSLFFSNIMKLPPCDLCWWQRIFMYPIPLLFLVALIRKEKFLKPYALILAITGSLVALYQYFLQISTLLNLQIDKIVPCSVNNISCSEVTRIAFGYITIPMASLVVFVLIILFLAYDKN